MLSFVLTAEDGGTAWRHDLAPDEARAGWECVGPAGFARRLGRLYGLRGEAGPHAERVAAYAARLAVIDDGSRSFSRSRLKDPWGVAEFLLGLRDALRAAGWDGEILDGGSARLSDIASAEVLDTAGLPVLGPGLADVFAALLHEVERTPVLAERLEIHVAAPKAALDAIVHRTLVALAAKGASIAQADDEVPQAPRHADLGRLQRALLGPAAGEPRTSLANDGSLICLEADTPLEAGELAAAYLRSRALASATLVAGRDLGAFEVAVARHGLPATGSQDRSRWRPALQVLPLRLALAFTPQDPYRAAELLMLPVSPLPRDLRRRLVEALAEQPGVGGPAWRDAVAAAVEHDAARARSENPQAPEAAAREAESQLRARVETWLGGAAYERDEGIPALGVAQVCGAVADWAEGRANAGAGSDRVAQGAAVVARTLARMLVALPPGAKLSPEHLDQLHDVVVGGGLESGDKPGGAGRPAIAHAPAAAQRGAREVIWWGFLGGGPEPRPEPWTAAEREALASHGGVSVDELGAKRGVEAWSWRQPILAASERLVLVRWRLEGTTPTVSHPLADEIEARVEHALRPCTISSEAALEAAAAHVAVTTSVRAPAPRIVPHAVFHVPPGIIPITRLSPSSLERLLGCPVAWVLEHSGALRRGAVSRIPSGNRLLGNFAHAILEDLLHGPEKLDLGEGTPDEASALAGRLFDRRVGSEAAPLVARTAKVEQHRARELICHAARALFALLQSGGWRVRGAEEKLTRRFEEADLAGSADLVLERDGSAAVLDLKLSTSSKYFREKLEKGEALQLALYAEMVRSSSGTPPTGYFLINRGEVLTVDHGAFPGARELAGPTMPDTLEAARDALRFWRRVLEEGIVASRREELREGADSVASGAAGAPVPSRGPGAIDAPCRFCEYDALCSIELREAAR